MNGPRRSAGRPWGGRRVLLALAAGLAGCGSGQSAPDAGQACDPPVRLAALPPAAAEASGVARDPRRPGLFWIHNDSGNDPVLFAVDTAGVLRARVAVEGGTARDVEDLALGRCGEELCLWLGDLGDNQSRHADTRVHRLPLPPLPAADTADVLEATVRVEASYRITYPDGAIDVEALAVDAARGELILISKGREGRVWLFVAPVPGLVPDGSGAGASAVAPATDVGPGPPGQVVDVKTRRVAALGLPAGGVSARLVTAADLSPDGRTLAVRTYTRLLFYDWPGSDGLGDRPRPREVVSLRPAQEPQGEGVTFGEEPEVLYLVSEALGSRPAQLSRIRCPAATR